MCKSLSQHQMIHIGIQETVSPYRIVRTKQSTTYFLACIGGKGKVLIDGSWRICKEGYACLLPAHTLNAFEAVDKQTWQFCWVCYQRPLEQRPFADASVPVMAQFNASPLRCAIQGLMDECSGIAQANLIQEWTDLVHAYVLRFIHPTDQPDTLKLLWDRVASSLGDEWSLSRLAHESGYSKEHLRRLCRRLLGRSPMHQVTYLRMRKATELLKNSQHTLDAVAHEVGYHNQFVFSNAFTKWIGWRPSEYRRSLPEIH
ncbi:MAG: AraC family transcriptional regulator [Verrucomicrobiota bacterium]